MDRLKVLATQGEKNRLELEKECHSNKVYNGEAFNRGVASTLNALIQYLDGDVEKLERACTCPGGFDIKL